ncbi:hypothetical protein QUD52_12270 [Lactococcus lactis]|uniref:Phage protein n=1 Tax=Lactococcus lactis TaxID=1358 RepID=A0AAW7J1B2_9LACT|nr:hypothetical protein [Lactococcus lactis]MDM7547787.1 hypothetical protein [Lactococcus lactis]
MPTFNTKEQATEAMKAINWLVSNTNQLAMLLEDFSECRDNCKAAVELTKQKAQEGQRKLNG